MISMLKPLIVGPLLLALPLSVANANLAITEIMSDAATTDGRNTIVGGPDFFELTNYGPEPVMLSGYSFSDASLWPIEREVFEGITIQPRESILFVKFNDVPTVTTTESFVRWWWGSSPKPINLQILFYHQPIGFNAAVGDGLRLWDADQRLVDSVDFGPSRTGRTFIHDSTTGDFGVTSSLGQEGAFKAASADDVGSPGLNSDPISLYCAQSISDDVACVGSIATLRGKAGGLPRAHYQWFFKDEPIVGLDQDFYIIPNVQPNSAGNYRLEASNGLETISCGTAELSITADSVAPMLEQIPEDLEIYAGQSARFYFSARACPQPKLQWYVDGVIIPGATEMTLRIPNMTLEDSGSVYSISVEHPLLPTNGKTNFHAKLSVIKRPHLHFTEIMSWPNDGASVEHYDWCELTNLGEEAVNLQGYRLWDTPNLDLAFQIQQKVIIQPGESIILVEHMTPRDFREWWGWIRAGLQILTFEGFGFSRDGDTVHLWNPGAENVTDFITAADFNKIFPVEQGRTWECPPGQEDCLLEDDFCGCLSENGVHGAFSALVGGDIGSPGFVTTTPYFINIVLEQTEARLTWKTIPGRSYRLSYKDQVTRTAAWIGLQEILATGPVLSLSLPVPAATETPCRFFQLEELP